MFDSVRVRLTLWYTGLLALILILFSLGSYLVLARSMLGRADTALVNVAGGFRSAILGELDQNSSDAALRSAATETLQEYRFQDYSFAVFGSDGILLAASEPASGSHSKVATAFDPIFSTAAIHTLIVEASQSDRTFETVSNGEKRFRGHAVRLLRNDPGSTIVVLQSLDREDNLLEDIIQNFLWVVPITVLLASAGGYFLARKSLAPIVSMSDRAGHIGAQNLHERLPVLNPQDELGHLARAFNSLLERLDHSFEHLRQFMADASHELRSPVSIVRGEAEVALSRPRPPEEYRESLVVVRDEARRLSRIVDDLFTLARADSGQYPLRPSDFYLDELIGECVRASQSIAAPQHITLSYSSDGELPIYGDEALLRRMTMNLLENAIKYSGAGGSVAVECRSVNGEYRITVTDTGPGIPADAQGQIFERFFRADKARSHIMGERAGAGLGLPIARWIAEAHQGRLELLRSDSTGSTFGAFFPVNAHAAARV